MGKMRLLLTSPLGLFCSHFGSSDISYLEYFPWNVRFMSVSQFMVTNYKQNERKLSQAFVLLKFGSDTATCDVILRQVYLGKSPNFRLILMKLQKAIATTTLNFGIIVQGLVCDK